MSEGTLYISEEMIEELYIRKDKIRTKIKELESRNNFYNEELEVQNTIEILEELLGDDE